MSIFKVGIYCSIEYVTSYKHNIYKLYENKYMYKLATHFRGGSINSPVIYPLFLKHASVGFDTITESVPQEATSKR